MELFVFNWQDNVFGDYLLGYFPFPSRIHGLVMRKFYGLGSSFFKNITSLWVI